MTTKKNAKRSGKTPDPLLRLSRRDLVNRIHAGFKSYAEQNSELARACADRDEAKNEISSLRSRLVTAENNATVRERELTRDLTEIVASVFAGTDRRHRIATQPDRRKAVWHNEERHLSWHRK
jgi:hypothetical protein